MTGNRRRRRLRAAGLTAAVALVAGCVAPGATGGDAASTGAPSTGSGDGSVPDAAPPPDADTAALVSAFEQGSPGDLEITRLAEGLVPPTNRWFSGLVFGEQPQPVFALPVSFGLVPGGFSLGVPVPVASEKAVVGPHIPAVTVGTGTTSAQVSAYDAATVTLDLLDGDSPSAQVVLGQGSPFVSVTAETDLDLTTDVTFEPDARGAVAQVAGQDWALVTEGTLEGTSLRLAVDQTATFYPLPDDATDEAAAVLAAAAADPVTGSEVGYGVGDDTARTTLRYTTRDGGDTVVAAMPHHLAAGVAGDACTLGSYPSVYGAIALCPGPELVTTVPALEPTAMLDLSGVDEQEQAALVAQLEADVAATPAHPSDTYFGAKALYRAAMLVALGAELGAPEVVEELRTATSDAIREWAEPQGCAERDFRCFLYDPVARGVVGLTPSFGSEVFNDHHFHWGYLLAAAGILGAQDEALVEDVAPLMNLLVQDIAAPRTTEWFPQMRPFDPYRGHSWASGTAPFADGNNQESTSEGVTAWNGLALWARASGQPELETQATWMMSTEAATARAYWTEPPLDDPSLEGFEHRMFSISWGAKRDYATWFSAEPNAILGIQLIPMVPVAGAMAADAEAVRASVAEATPNGYGVQFGDYLLMYLALVDPEAARAAAVDLPDDAIDGASSRTYLQAWLASPPARAGG